MLKKKTEIKKERRIVMNLDIVVPRLNANDLVINLHHSFLIQKNVNINQIVTS